MSVSQKENILIEPMWAGQEDISWKGWKSSRQMFAESIALRSPHDTTFRWGKASQRQDYETK
jgi:hypothetical protein